VQEIIPEWQTAASALLVAVGVRHCNDVMSELLEKFQPGVLPHFFVVQTLANLATANGKYSVGFTAVVDSPYSHISCEFYGCEKLFCLPVVANCDVICILEIFLLTYLLWGEVQLVITLVCSRKGIQRHNERKYMFMYLTQLTLNISTQIYCFTLIYLLHMVL